jgi:signal transduction histidine kinase
MEEPVCVSMSVVGVRTGEGGDVSLHWMVQDISERKRVEKDLQRHTEELARLNQELASAHREANLYLDILTHDIRNTENVSNLYAELLADKLQGEAAQYMENLQQSIRKSIEILSMVSTIRRVHRAKSILKPVGLEAVIREAGRNVESTSFHYHGTGTHSQVWADDLLLVVFNNLIGNAVKHGGPNVRIFVRVEEEEGGMLISVEDTGPGVPDEAKEEIFRVYETQKRGVGEGLGLYLAQVLVERYGGRIWVEDRVPGRSGEGAAFRLTLRKVA